MQHASLPAAAVTEAAGKRRSTTWSALRRPATQCVPCESCCTRTERRYARTKIRSVRSFQLQLSECGPYAPDICAKPLASCTKGIPIQGASLRKTTTLVPMSLRYCSVNFHEHDFEQIEVACEPNGKHKARLASQVIDKLAGVQRQLELDHTPRSEAPAQAHSYSFKPPNAPACHVRCYSRPCSSSAWAHPRSALASSHLRPRALRTSPAKPALPLAASTATVS